MAVGEGVHEGQHAAGDARQHVGPSDGAHEELHRGEVAGGSKDSQDDQPIAEHRDQDDDPDSQADDPALKQVITGLEGTWKTNPKLHPADTASLQWCCSEWWPSPSPLLAPPAM